MKVLIVYYSRSGKTRKIAKQIGLKINADLEEIKDNKNRAGIFGFINSGNEAYFKKTIPLNALEKDISQYDTVVIGTPVWASNIATPIRSFLREYQDKLNKVAFFCTSLGSDPKPVFLTMEELSARKPIAVINITTRDMKRMFHLEMVDKFVQDIKQANK
jgi:menaquinone-dependent protoporphyrinogen IX oxidase